LREVPDPYTLDGRMRSLMTHTPVPCVGGPFDGRAIALEDGVRESCIRDRFGTWHRHLLRSDDGELILQYVGPIAKPPRWLPPIPSLW